MDKTLVTRISELEFKIKSRSNIPVLVVDEDEPGIYTYKDMTFTREQLDKFCTDRGVETLIIDDLRRNDL